AAQPDGDEPTPPDGRCGVRAYGNRRPRLDAGARRGHDLPGSATRLLCQGHSGAYGPPPLARLPGSCRLVTAGLRGRLRARAAARRTLGDVAGRRVDARNRTLRRGRQPPLTYRTYRTYRT